MVGYRKYDDSIKEMVVRSGSPNMFPELKIPRMTALYWIRSAKKKIRIKDVGLDKALLEKISRLEKELEVERAKNMFLSELLKSLHGLREIYNLKRNRETIVDVVEKYKKWISIESLCKAMRIRSDKYYRLRVETKGCPRISFNKCKIMAPNQLTFMEQKKLCRMVHDPKLSHLSVKGLQYHGYRYENLYFGYDCWRKYVREFRGIRLKKSMRKKARLGIRAKRVNEIWHIDITEFRLKNGSKIYLQVLMDNFSRKIINWKLSSSKNQTLTIKNLKEAVKLNNPDVLMSDGGGENIGEQVCKMLVGRNIVKMIAKKDVIFSNSMVESFFHVLKTRFINKYKLVSLSKLFKKIKRAVSLFNGMPTSSLDGATPIEVYDERINQDVLKKDLATKRHEWMLFRPEVNKTCMLGKFCNT
jgi:hypothetical protein